MVQAHAHIFWAGVHSQFWPIWSKLYFNRPNWGQFQWFYQVCQGRYQTNNRDFPLTILWYQSWKQMKINVGQPYCLSSWRGNLYKCVPQPDRSWGTHLYGFDWNTNLLVDIRVTNLDSKSQVQTMPDKVLEVNEQRKKADYLDSCLDQWRHFTPFNVSTDGMLGCEVSIISDVWILSCHTSGNRNTPMCAYTSKTSSKYP